MSNVGKWAPWYEGARWQLPYADTVTYGMAADFLAGLPVEDWGCGYAFFKRLHLGPYVGVDGTANQFVDVVDDLETRVSETPGLLLRHVLEHNPRWPLVLQNAIRSASRRLVIVTFTPDSEDGARIGWTDELGVPDIAIPHRAVDYALAGGDVTRWPDLPSGWESDPWRHEASGWDVETVTLQTPTAYGVETIWRASRWP